MKKIAALFLLLCMTVSLAACGEKTPSGTASSASSQTSSVSSGKVEEPGTADPVPNMVMACDQKNERIVVYDLDQLDPGDPLEDGEVWSLDAGYAADMKYREDTVFGDVVLVAGSVSGIYSYPEGKAIATTNNPGSNPHAIEILPSGNVVVANSTGGTLRLFPASALLNAEGETSPALAYQDYPLKGAHGVVWDPESEVLWALGDDELVAYLLMGDGPDQTMTKVGGMGGVLPKNFEGGHDLSADLTDSRYLYLTTNGGPLRFDKEEGVFIEKFDQYAKIPTEYLKGLSNNPNGNFLFCNSNFGKGTSWEHETFAGWCTDSISFGYWKSKGFLYVQQYTSQTSAFYKVRAFCGQYQ